MRRERMRLLVVLLMLVAGVGSEDSSAQGKKKGPPPWAPAHGYRAKTRHVYFPEYNFYFDVQRGVYIYLKAGSWTVAAEFPTIFSGLNLNTSVQVELDLDTDSPQKFNVDHVTKYKVKKEKKTPPGKTKRGKKM
jgi:hypothetical protein